MAELARAVASLRITGDDLVPDEITAHLGCDPTRSYARGDTLNWKDTPPRVARFGFWSLEADETTPADLDVQVAGLLSRLTADEATWERLRAEYDMDLFCGWFMRRLNEGASIEPETLAALGTRGIRLDIDLYGAYEDELETSAPGPEEAHS